MRVRAGLAFLLACVAALAGSPALAVFAGGGHGAIKVRDGWEGVQAAVIAARSGATVPRPPPPAEVLYPACAGNSPTTQTDTMCLGLDRNCPPGQLQAWVFQAPTGTAPGEPGWVQVGRRCTATGGFGVVREPVIVTEAFFRTIPLPAPPAQVQPPPGAIGLVNKETNLFAAAQDPVVVDTDLGGVPVRVRATPTMWSWDVGWKGHQVGPSADPGGPYPQLVNTYTYTEPGEYPVTLTTWYTGEFSVDGGPWQPVDGVAWADSPPVTVTVRAGHNVLVDPDG